MSGLGSRIKTEGLPILCYSHAVSKFMVLRAPDHSIQEHFEASRGSRYVEQFLSPSPGGDRNAGRMYFHAGCSEFDAGLCGFGDSGPLREVYTTANGVTIIGYSDMPARSWA